MKRLSHTLFTLLLLVASGNIFAWGHKGHALVAEVAFHYMDATAKERVMKYLDGMSIEDAANWMDAIKSDHANDYMKPYHYIDIEKGSKEMPAGDNIITVLNKTLKDLDNMKSLSKEEVKTKILYVMHLIGDLHQPLHIGYPGDRGGNDIKLSFFGRNSNLHAVWDNDIIEMKNLSLADLLRINKDNTQELVAPKIDVIKWAAETRSYVKNAYTLPDGKINDLYVNANSPIIESQLFNAGIRLAIILDHYFDGVQS